MLDAWTLVLTVDARVGTRGRFSRWGLGDFGLQKSLRGKWADYLWSGATSGGGGPMVGMALVGRLWWGRTLAVRAHHASVAKRERQDRGHQELLGTSRIGAIGEV